MIKFERVTFGYESGKEILREVSFEISKGEKVCLVGRNGSGKTTILKLIAKLLEPGRGSCVITCDHTPDKWESRIPGYGVGYVFQNPEDQIVSTTVEGDIAFALENLAVPQAAIEDRVAVEAERFGIGAYLSRHPESLSAGEKQRCALAGVVITSPQLLLLDEPTSFLDLKGRELLLKTALEDSRYTVVAATQYLNEMERYDRLLFLEEGEITFDGSLKSFRDTTIWKTIIASNHAARDRVENQTLVKQSAVDEGIRFDKVHFAYPKSPAVFEELSVSIPQESATAVMGNSGSGKTTLALLLAGILQPDRGALTVPNVTGPHQSVSLLFQFPEIGFFAETVFEEIAFGVQNLRLSESEQSQRVREALETVQLDYEKFASRNPFTLSVGEQRRVAIASVLVLERPIIIFDETTLGLDWEGRRLLIEILERLKSSGKTIIMITHDIDFVLETADRIVLLEEGRVKKEFDLGSESVLRETIAAHLGVATIAG